MIPYDDLGIRRLIDAGTQPHVFRWSWSGGWGRPRGQSSFVSESVVSGRGARTQDFARAVAGVDEPSPFACVGLGVNGAIKPELIYYGAICFLKVSAIGPSRDHLGALLALVDQLVELRLTAKANARQSAPESAERYKHEALSAAMKLVVNSAYGYLAAGGLTRFADVHAANEVTRRGRETLELMCRQLTSRGVTLLEADTDGVYFAAPEAWAEADERRAVAEVAAMLAPRVQLEFEGRYAAMLSHEPKNYALLRYDGSLILHGVAFRSSRAEPFGEAFLRKAVTHLLASDVPGVREAYLAALDRLRRRELPTRDVSSCVRLTKTPAAYFAVRESRRELPYEAMLASGRASWSVNDRVRVYRKRNGGCGLLEEPEDGQVGRDDVDHRDYDVDHYARQLRQTFASRLARSFASRLQKCGQYLKNVVRIGKGAPANDAFVSRQRSRTFGKPYRNGVT
jgi:DNA polymerase elongation subunit (family B)